MESARATALSFSLLACVDLSFPPSSALPPAYSVSHVFLPLPACLAVHAAMPSQPIPSVFRQHRSGLAASTPGHRPLTLTELSELATSGANRSSLTVDSSIPIGRYIIGSETLTKQAETCMHNGNLDEAFISLVKNCKLLIEVLPTQHRGYKTLDSETKQKLKERGQWHLDQLSQVKSRIVDRFEAWRSQFPDAPLEEGARRRGEEEEERRDKMRPVPSTGVMESLYLQPSSSAAPSIDYVRPARSDGNFGLDVRNQSSGSRARPSHFPPSPSKPFTHSHSRQVADASSPRIEYPTLRPASSIRMNSHQVSQGFAPRSEQTYKYYQIQASPPRARGPSFPVAQTSLRAASTASSLQSSLNFSYPTISSRESNRAAPLSSSIDQEARRLLGDHQYAHTPTSSVRGSTTEGGEPLRTLIIPASLISTFVSIAERNTRINIETCGLLMGTMDANMLQVNHLLIPKQTATSDRCDTQDEEGIWNFMESRGLVTLGWCHTHPQQ